MNFIRSARQFINFSSLINYRFWWVIRLSLLILVFVALYFVVPVSELIDAFTSANPGYLALGMGLSLVFSFLTAIQLTILISRLGFRHNIFDVFVINLVVKFYSLVTPGTFVGSSVRWYRLAQPEGKSVEALAALVFFRIMEFFLTIVFGITFWALSGYPSIQLKFSWIAALFVGSILFWLVITRISRQWIAHLEQWLANPGIHPLTRGIAQRFVRFLHSISAYSDSSALVLSLAIIAGLGSMMIAVGSGIFLARAVGIEFGFLQFGWINALVMLVTQLPISVAGGLGVREASLVALLPDLGISPEKALAFSLLLSLRGILLSILGGILEGVIVLRNINTA